MTKGFKALPGTKKVLWGLGILLAPLFIVSAVSPTPDMQQAAQSNHDDTSTTISHVKAPEAPTPQPQVMKAETKSVTETVAVPFQSITQEDASLEAGKSIVAVAGTNGEKQITYEVTYADGTETDRKQVHEQMVKAPVNEIKKIGTKAPAAKLSTGKCHPSYADACVPIAMDVDCKGGSGDGPAFVRGPLRVIGYDVYHLDRDGNGVGCE